MSTKGQEKLAEEPKDEHELSEDIQEEETKLEDIRARESAELVKRMSDLTDAVNKLSGQLQKASFKSPSMDEVRKSPARDPLESAKNPKPDKTLKKAEDKVQEILDGNDKKKPAGNDGKLPADPKEWSASKFAYIITGLTVFGPMLLQLFEGIVRAMGGKPLDPLGLPDELTAKLLAFAVEKKSETAADFWKDIGTYVGKSPDATSADLIMLLQFIVKTNPLDTPFIWASFEEAGSMAAKLSPQYTADKVKFFTGLGALQTSDGKSLPRATAAGVAQSAIALSLL